MVQSPDGTIKQSSIFSSEYNFGPLDNSIVKMYSPNLISYTITSTPQTGLTATQLQRYLYGNGSTNTDTQDAIFLSSNTALADNAAAEVIADYLLKGGVVVLCSSQVASKPSYIPDNRRVYVTGTGNLALMKKLFGDQVTLKTGTFGGQCTWRLPYAASTDLSLNGPFADIRGQYLSTNSFVYPLDRKTYSFLNTYAGISYDGIPINKLDWYITATDYNTGVSSTDIVAFKATDYNLIWIADPEIFYFSGTTGTTATLNMDITNKVTGSSGTLINTYKPIDLWGTNSYPTGQGVNTSPYNTVNSKFMANLLMWAINAAQYGAINNPK